MLINSYDSNGLKKCYYTNHNGLITMNKKSGSIIQNGDTLAPGEYIQSNNLFFYAIMQPDGNFGVYRGTGPENPSWVLWSTRATSKHSVHAWMMPDGNFSVVTDDGKTPIWNAATDSKSHWSPQNIGPSPSKCYAIMQDDGNFCIYAPNNPTAVWFSGNADPVTDFDIENITYHLKETKILRDSLTDSFSQTVINNSSQTQTSTISHSVSVTWTSAWSTSMGIKIGIKQTFETGIPFLVGGKTELSAEASWNYTWSGSDSKTDTWEFSVPIEVAPHSTGIVIAGTYIATLSVPYTLYGTAYFQSGAMLINATTPGVFNGISSHKPFVSYLPSTSSDREELKAKINFSGFKK